ncbi:uncharacterized protein EI90DRAFT_3133111 [Cantharellus anzutake]|uniref:uncharacterized protein n=1 Tax=Cantharellus anzutake TaxID=1750568 RepID=UPI0019034CED|nr:uncharacterized protein EI90DRAFT_3133111 [Cantharellus anzutake]KAF8318622.1 hypothetical protein EI90DRAFT_3133111 [Cantharellus anzutake]
MINFRQLVSWVSLPDAASPLVECKELENGAGRGLFATMDVPPNTPLIVLPGSKLLNKFTLRSSYPTSALDLTSMQLLSMHLFLHREGENDSFSPFIASLPQSFDSHPVAWYARAQLQTDPTASMLPKELISRIPETASARITATHARYQHDIEQLPVQKGNVELAKSRCSTRSEEEDFLWSWLCVNTRCIHLPITSTSSPEEDLTLVPLLDLANHSPDLPRACQFEVKYICDTRRGPSGSPHAPRSVILRSPASVTVKAGEEILLQYGHHSNSALFSEYGFTLERRLDSDPSEVNLDYAIRLLLQPYASMKDLLERWDYWLDWTIHTSPPPAHPSYRLLTVLRLLALPSSAIAAASQDLDSSPVRPKFPTGWPSEDPYDCWKATVLGFADNVSETNEQKARDQLLMICQSLNEQAKGILRADRLALSLTGATPTWLLYADHCLHGLWREVENTTRLVMESIARGEVF